MSKDSSTWSEINPLVLTTIHEVLAAIDSPTSLGIHLRIRENSLGDLPVVAPINYCDVSKFCEDAQALGLVKKIEGHIPARPALADEAIQRFFGVETHVKSVNEFLTSPSLHCNRTRALIVYARRIIHDVLGTIDLDWRLSFGPGTTLSKKGRPSHILAKLGDTNGLSITPGAVYHMHKLCLSDKAAYAWFVSNGLLHPLSLRFTDQLKVVDYERFATVPKDFTQLRCISTQPDCNIILQKVVGDAIRRRYDSYFATELRHVPTEHKALMKFASSTGCLSTIDLKNASDSIPSALVELLLPNDWLRLLKDLRPNSIMVNGDLHSAQRFSANGNGYTFELETLLFRAICEATLELENSTDYAWCSVFGDDILVTSHDGAACVKSLELLGFTVNVAKTFVGTEPGFRESCGSDWFDGRNVRPIYFRSFSNGIEGAYALANRVHRIATIATHSWNGDTNNADILARLESTLAGVNASVISPELIRLTHFLDRRFQRAFRNVLAAIPSKLRFGGPQILGDTVLHSVQPVLKVSLHGCLTDYGHNGNGYIEFKALGRKTTRLPLARLGSPFLQIVYVALGGESEGVSPRNASYEINFKGSYSLPPDDVVWC